MPQRPKETPAEFHVCQELLRSLWTAPQPPRAPLHPSFPPSIPVPRHRPLSTHSTGLLEFYKPGLEQSCCEMKHPDFSILGDPCGKSCFSQRKPISRYSLIPAFLPSPLIYSRDTL